MASSRQGTYIYAILLDLYVCDHNCFDFDLNFGFYSIIFQEASIPTTRHDEEVKRGLEIGLPGASSIEDRTIPTFSRGELPHFAGINTFMKAPFVENIHDVGNYDATVVS